MNADTALHTLQKLPGDDGQRLYQELHYARRVAAREGDALTRLVDEAALEAMRILSEEGALNRAAVRRVESMLLPMRDACKKYVWLLVGHAHIDMNWLWRYDETVAVTLDTFRTMLTLMDEYPLFTFGQSQASTYRIVEEYDPDMLSEIRARVREGRWEVTASSWVEPDRNLPSLESEARHILYTKEYLSRLLRIAPDDMRLDFEPDSFGHNALLPDVLKKAGVDYLYHCRGEREASLYVWRGNGGAEVLAYCDPAWYNLTVSGDLAARVPDFCGQYGVPAMLTVYGVGDHGGGPTRRDLNRIQDMMTWPIFPTVRFGTYREFFSLCEPRRNALPVLTGERNCVFTGCYTSQSRIKKANLMAERTLAAAETFGALAHHFAGAPYREKSLSDAWIKTLFNHFHDILPGSGVRDTREFALGEYQKVFAAATAGRRAAYAALAAHIDTSRFDTRMSADETAQGAGIGFHMWEGQTPPYSVSAGDTRVFHVWNAMPFSREEAVEITVWDYLRDASLMRFEDGSGRTLLHQIVGDGVAVDWNHRFHLVLVWMTVPACGYATAVLRTSEGTLPAPIGCTDPGMRRQEPFDMTLENEEVSAAFDAMTGRMISLKDKRTGRVAATNAGFDFIMEDPSLGMTAWTVGRYMRVCPVSASVKIRKTLAGPIRQAYELSAPLSERSRLRVTVSLDKGARGPVFDVHCDWHERGGDAGIPQLSFSTCLPETGGAYTYRIPGGLIARGAQAQDKPSLGAAARGGTALLCDSRYGFRGDGDQMRVAIVRSSVDPDPNPELGDVACRVALSADEVHTLYRQTEAFARRMDVTTNTCHAGQLPLDHAFLWQEGDEMELNGLKRAQDGRGYMLHLCNPYARPARTRIRFAAPVLSAVMTDYLERDGDACPATGDGVEVALPENGLAAIRVCLKENA